MNLEPADPNRRTREPETRRTCLDPPAPNAPSFSKDYLGVFCRDLDLNLADLLIGGMGR